MSRTQKKIFIVDNHPLLRTGLKRLIEHETNIAVVGEAGNSMGALQKIKSIQPDLVITDIDLQGLSGMDLTVKILSDNPQALILILSMYDESLYAERALKTGAKGYIMKKEPIIEIAAAIRRVLEGNIYLSGPMRERLIEAKTTTIRDLSNREWEVMHLMGQGLLTRQIGQLLCISVKTIDSHYASLKAKLNLKNMHQLMKYAVTHTIQS